MSVLVEERAASGGRGADIPGARGLVGYRRPRVAHALRRPPARSVPIGRRPSGPYGCSPRRRARGRASGASVVGSLVAGVAGLVVLLGVTLGGLSEAGGAPVPERTALVTVEQGQSLWEIATEYAPASDPRAVVERITALNDLAPGAVPAGYPIAVPVQG